MLTHSKISKFAFIGTSSAGKTTATYETCGFLKRHGIRVDGILQQDRRLPFPAALLETHAEAQYWFITNMMTAENYLALQPGVDCIVSDRSVLDFFAYAETQWPGQVNDLRQMVVSWVSTYDTLYYLPPREYDNDGVRPSDEFRLEVDKTLNNLILRSPDIARVVAQVPSWEMAARQIAIATKRAQLHPNARITGSWNSGKFKPGSDFDFILLPWEWHEVQVRLGSASDFYPVDHQPFVEQHNDQGLIAVFRSKNLNMDVQIQRDGDSLHKRLLANEAESDT
jgi:hypothetical protein